MSDYFCGWYFKCQSDTGTLAVIPAVHESDGRRSCSIQLITDEGAWNVNFPLEQFGLRERFCSKKQSGSKERFDSKKRFCPDEPFFQWKPLQMQRKGRSVQIGENYFGEKGIRLNLQTPECSAVGVLRVGVLTPIRYDIMGPFRYVPFMECRHGVWSMRHTVNGVLRINGAAYRFHDGIGYIEGDRGYSFPKEYAWTHCFFEDGSLMLSVADIPFGLFHFTGIVGVVWWRGREYRLATYLGAGAARIRNGEIVVRQGDMVLSVRLLEKKSHPLFAPVSGAMCRTIRESASCRAAYCFEKKGNTLFDFETSRASFEYEFRR